MDIESYKVDAKDEGKSLVQFIAERRETSKRKAKGLLDKRRVYVNRQRVWMAKHRLQRGDQVEVQVEKGEGGERVGGRKIVILHRDATKLVVDKPAGMLTQGRNSVEERLREQLGVDSVVAVHRLDRDTSGCLMFALNEEARDHLVELFRQRVVGKEYLAIVAGPYRRGKEAIEKRIDGKSALTRVVVLDSNKRASLLSCRIETGRTHQIRKHLASIGNPVAGDKKYGHKFVEQEVFRCIPRQMLHARRLQFVDSQVGAQLDCVAPVPTDFRETAKRLALQLS